MFHVEHLYCAYSFIFYYFVLVICSVKEVFVSLLLVPLIFHFKTLLWTPLVFPEE